MMWQLENIYVFMNPLSLHKGLYWGMLMDPTSANINIESYDYSRKHRRLLLKLDKQIGGTIYWPFLASNKA